MGILYQPLIFLRKALSHCRGGFGWLLVKEDQENLPKLADCLKNENDFVTRVFPYLETVELFKYEIVLLCELASFEHDALKEEIAISWICKTLTSFAHPLIPC